MLLIGDVHGLVNQYFKILQRCKGKSLQVGDFGFKKHHDWLLENKHINKDEHKILFGNHDYYPYLDKPYSIGDYAMHEGMFCIRGAKSIDRHNRAEGLDWFPEEELNYRQFWELTDEYERLRPDIVVSHDCPKSVAQSLYGYYDTGRAADRSITSDSMDAMFEIHRPKIWVFGHHHMSKDITIMDTRFVCLNELETVELKTLLNG